MSFVTDLVLYLRHRDYLRGSHLVIRVRVIRMSYATECFCCASVAFWFGFVMLVFCCKGSCLGFWIDSCIGGSLSFGNKSISEFKKKIINKPFNGSTYVVCFGIGPSRQSRSIVSISYKGIFILLPFSCILMGFFCFSFIESTLFLRKIQERATKTSRTKSIQTSTYQHIRNQKKLLFSFPFFQLSSSSYHQKHEN